MKKYIIITLLVIFGIGCQSTEQQGKIVEISTAHGTIKIRLYEDVPKHTENFIKLAKEGFFDNTAFHRVIKEFMIQGGDPYSKQDSLRPRWGTGGPGYELDAEIKPQYFHKRGAVAAARQMDQINPNRKSSGSQFYIVVGKKFTEQELTTIEQQIDQANFQSFAMQYLQRPEFEYLKKIDIPKLQKENPDSLMRLDMKIQNQIMEAFKKEGKPSFKFTDEQKKIYQEQGGAPYLDGQYTVFGEVIEGMEVVEKISQVETLENDVPAKDIKITVKVHD